MIDSSNSIKRYGRGKFKRIINFVKRIVLSFKISPRYTRVAVVMFNRYPKVMMKFRAYRGLRGTLKTIDKMRFPGRGRNLPKALQKARYLFGRRSAKRSRVVIVLSHGILRYRPESNRAQLIRAGAKVFSVALGRQYRITELRNLASSRKYILTSGYGNLAASVGILKNKICKGKYFVN